ncbi:Prame Family Member 18 [Manis pentadactyla]|nr:Prame Family Member 18 [Manis pentadactyla]
MKQVQEMDDKTTGTLLELAAKSLLSNELAAIHALDELPRDLFVPLFIPAFMGKHKEVLKSMVRVWPFRCLHIGTLSVHGSDYDILEAMIDGLQLLSAQNSSSCRPKLRLLDLRSQRYCKRKVWQSFGSLHLCCRHLKIGNMSAHRSMMRFLDPRCIDHLEVDLAHLREVNILVAKTAHLYSLRLSNMRFICYEGRHFQTFIHCLGNLDSLQELDLSTLYLRDRLHRFLRGLPPQMETLNLSFCDLSIKDVTILSQSSLASHLRQLNLSHNEIFSESYEPFQALLERASALSHCLCLHVLSFAFNPITMPVLMSLLQHLTPLMELKHVNYAIPVHCYKQWDVRDSLDQQQLTEVQAQLKAMLQALQREDMHWTSHSA